MVKKFSGNATVFEKMQELWFTLTFAEAIHSCALLVQCWMRKIHCLRSIPQREDHKPQWKQAKPYNHLENRTLFSFRGEQLLKHVQTNKNFCFSEFYSLLRPEFLCQEKLPPSWIYNSSDSYNSYFSFQPHGSNQLSEEV